MPGYLRQDLNTLEPYRVESIPYKAKMDANESPFDLPEIIRRKLADEILEGSGLNRYPDTDALALRVDLAQYCGLHPEQLMVGAGSDELLQIAVNAFIQKDDVVLCPAPSFGMYAVFTRIAGGVPVDIPLGQDFEYDMDRYYDAIKEYRPKMIFLCSPNNPTGNVMRKQDIFDLLDKYDGVVALDEAYVEFHGDSFIGNISEHQNMIVFRTFSKAMGLAGLRIGYLAADRAMADDLYRVKPPYNINSFSQRAAQLILENRDIVEERISETISQRNSMARCLGMIKGIKVYASGANFILVKVCDAKFLYNMLLQKGILVRNFFSNSRLADHLRITVGSRKENEMLLSSIHGIMEEA